MKSMESDEEYNSRYQHEVNGKSLPGALKKITKASFIKMVKAGEIPGWSWIDDKDGNKPSTPTQ
jgi:hypothetical protein